MSVFGGGPDAAIFGVLDSDDLIHWLSAAELVPVAFGDA
jgi:hypothetical protein